MINALITDAQIGRPCGLIPEQVLEHRARRPLGGALAHVRELLGTAHGEATAKRVSSSG